MNKLIEQALLYDFYGELLTEHQRSVYEEVVLNDYSISEVAQEAGISRQGVHDMIKRCSKILEDQGVEVFSMGDKQNPKEVNMACKSCH